MASGFEMRVGDAEREATAAELREHYASGRLTLDELNERIDKAFAAKTRGDLDALMRDLPSARPGTAGQSWQPGQPGARPVGPGWGQESGWSQGAGRGPGAGRESAGGWAGSGAGWGSGQGARAAGAAHRTIGAIVSSCVLICALVVIGSLGIFGIGTGRPFGIALLVLAFGLLRRLVFGRRRSRGCAPRGRRRW